jgi:hypothetical protein
VVRPSRFRFWCLLAGLPACVALEACSSDLSKAFESPAGLTHDAGRQALGDCPAGTRSFSGLDAGAPGCEPCEVGMYCPGGGMTPQLCVAGTWDHDGDPQTRCESWMDCPVGEYVLSKGDATQDRACAPCEAGTFSVASRWLMDIKWPTAPL